MESLKEFGIPLKSAVKQAKHVKTQMRAIKPEAFKGLKGVEMRYPFSRLGVEGEYWMNRIRLSQKHDPLTFSHEMGHHLMASDPTHPLHRMHQPGYSRTKDLERIEKAADAFANLVGQKTGGRKTKYARSEDTIALSKWLASLGLATGGSMGLLDILSPQEAEAAPIGKYTKGVVKGVESSAAKALRDLEYSKGKIITEVRKGRGNWRSLHFADGTQMTVKAKHINDLCRASGTARKLAEFAEKEGESKLLQALRSLQYHEARAPIMMRRDTTRLLTREYIKTVDQMAAHLSPDTVYVTYNGKFFTMPREYAEYLERVGTTGFKIQKGTRDRIR